MTKFNKCFLRKVLGKNAKLKDKKDEMLVLSPLIWDQNKTIKSL
jgi:hypothetical protein